MKIQRELLRGYLQISIVPLLVTIWGIYIYMQSLPFYVKGCDPEYPYLINGLNMALLKFGQIGHVDHPGTPFQLFVGIIIRLTHLFAGNDSMTIDVLNRPELYLGAVSVALTLITSALVFYIGKLALKSFSLVSVIILQLTPFFQEVLIDSFLRVTPDRFHVVVSLLLIIVLLKYYFRENPDQLRFSIWLGAVVALGFAAKINYFPVAVLAFFLPQNWKDRGVYVLSGLLSFVLFISPILGKFQAFKHFIFDIIGHDGLHGSGESQVFNSSHLIENVKLIFETCPELWLVVAITILGFVFAMLNPKVRKPGGLFYLGYALLIAVQILFVAKHYKNYYLTPLFSTYGLFLFATLYFLQSDAKFTKLTKVLQYALPIVLLFLSANQFRNSINDSKSDNARLRREAADFASTQISRNDYWFVEPTWQSGPEVENALVYGFAYCADRVNYEKALKKTYPNVITSDAGSNIVRFWHSSTAALDTVLVSGKSIHILDNPDRNAAHLVQTIQLGAAELGITVTKDTVFAQNETATYILKLTPQFQAGQLDSLRNEMIAKYGVVKSEFQQKLEYYSREIRNTPEWLNKVQRKAEERGISLDSMIYLDAGYMIEHE